MGRVSRGTGLAPHSNCVRGSPILGRLDRTIALAELEVGHRIRPDLSSWEEGREAGRD